MSISSETVLSCGCKGVRSCSVCQAYKPSKQEPFPQFEFNLCNDCAMAYRNSHKCHGSMGCGEFPFHCVFVVPNFVTEEEELFLLDQIDRDPWALSQSGRRKQDYGPKVNFKRQRVTLGRFTGLPSYSRFLVDRINQTIQTCRQVQQASFVPVELCNLEYCPERGASIVPHLDDIWLWGDRLITLSLCSSTTLTFTLPTSTEALVEFERLQAILDPKLNITSPGDVAVRVPLPRRSLVIVDGPARYAWFHSIRSVDIRSRRIAMTFRELSKPFIPEPDISEPETQQCSEDQLMGRKLLNIAQTFQGAVCSSQ